MVDQVTLLARDGGEFVVNTVTAGDQFAPSVTKLASGGFVVIWTDESGQTDTNQFGVMAQVYDSSGAKVGGEKLVNTTIEGSQHGIQAVALANGGFVVIWSHQTHWTQPADLRGQVFDAAGSKVGAETVLQVGYGSAVAAGGDGFVLVMPTGAGQLYDASGAKIGPGFQVADTTQQNATSYAAPLAGGGFVVVVAPWSSQNGPTIQIFNAQGQKVGSEITRPVVDFLSLNTVASLSNGGFLLGYYDSSTVHVQRFDAAGTAVGQMIPIDPSWEGKQSELSLAPLPGGGFFASWRETTATGAESSIVKGQVFGADGSRLGTEFTVNTTTGTFNPSPFHAQPSVALIGGDRIAVVWHGDGPGDARSEGWTIDRIDGGIRAAIFKPLADPSLDISASATTLSEIAVEGLAAIRLSTTSAAVNAAYSYSLADDSTGGGFRLSGDLLIVADAERFDFEAGQVASVTVLVTDSAGNVRDEVFQFSVADASPEPRYRASDERIVNTQQNDIQNDPALARLSGGGYVVTWVDTGFASDGSFDSVRAQVYDASGNKVGTEILVNTLTASRQWQPAVSGLPGGGFAVTWTDDSNQGGDNNLASIAMQIFSAGGAKVGSQILVNSTTSQNQLNPTMATLTDGRLLVAWVDSSLTGADTSGAAVRAQLFDAAGIKIGGEFLVNTSTPNGQAEPIVAALPGGRFVIAWDDSSGLGGDIGSSIKAQMFNADGSKAGGEVLVNTIVAGPQNSSALDAAADGSFLVAWRSVSADKITINAQLFDAAGAKSGGEFVVATGTVTQPRVAARPEGGYIVTFSQTSALDPTTGVMGQLLSASGQKIGDAFLINGTGDGQQSDSAVVVLGSGSIVTAWADAPGRGVGEVKARLLVSTDVPLARNDSFATGEAGTVAGNLFADNGSGADGGTALSVVAVNGSAAAVGQQITLASGARLTVGAGGALSYDPNGAFNHLVSASSGARVNTSATDSFTYSVPGGSTGMVTILISGAASPGDRYVGTLTADHIVGADHGEIFIISQDAYTADGALDHFEGRGGDDLFYVGRNFRANTTIEGGAGFDTLVVQGSNPYLVGTFSGIERILFLTASDNSYGGAPEAGSHTGITLRAGALEAGATLNVDSSGRMASETAYFSAQNLTAGRIVAHGGPGTDTFIGGADMDELNGGPGDDKLDGRGGADLMRGGAGNDQYHVDNVGDVIEELANGGTDTVRTSFAAYVLPDLLERLVGTGSGQGLFGNAANNVIEGSPGNDLIDGGPGADAMDGAAGSDVYIVDEAGDSVHDSGWGDADEIRTALAVYSSAWNRSIEKLTGTSDGGQALTGSVSADIISGAGGNDVITGGGGADTLSGGGGADRFVYLSPADSQSDRSDLIVGFEPGLDTIDVSPLGRVTLSFTSGSDNGTAFTLVGVTRFYGGETMSIRVDGSVGKSDLIAEIGIVGTPYDDVLTGTAETDEIRGLDGSDGLYGRGGDDLLEGGAGIDLLDGGTGNDTMRGGDGGDLYMVDDQGDEVVEIPGEGSNDRVWTSLSSYSLTANVETLTGTSNAGQTLTGNALANLITGGPGNDTLDGGAGADTMRGGDGDDVYIVDHAGDFVEETGEGTDEIRTALAAYTLPGGAPVENLRGLSAAGQALTGNARGNQIVGGAGDDVIEGGVGADLLVGGGGADRFVYRSAWESVEGSRDRIAHFEQGADKIDLLALGMVRLSSSSAADGIGAYTLLTVTGAATTMTIRVDGTIGEADVLAQTGIVGTAGDDILEGTADADSIRGLAGNDSLYGRGGSDAIEGDAGNDLIDGGAGADAMQGGAGDDIYYVDDAGDTVFERPGEGDDEVRTSLLSTVLANHVERLTGLSDAGQTLIGNEGANRVTGGNGADTLLGGQGDDTLEAGAGNDFMSGNAGADAMRGGTGNDDYYVEQEGDTVEELAGEGDDTVHVSLAAYTLGANLERLYGFASGGQALTGNALANEILGAEGNDVIDGGAGADTMRGGDGDDVYLVDDAGDTVFDQAGVDEIRTALGDYVLTDASRIENLTGTATTGRQALVGNALANTIAAGAGDDHLDGGTGADTMRGGAGNDGYVVDDAGDVVVEEANGGTEDIVHTSLAAYTLAANVEKLYGLGSAPQALTGNGLDNVVLTLGSGDDILDGGAGADTLVGRMGNDIYLVDQEGDVAVEWANEGTDEIRSSAAAYTIAAEVEILRGVLDTGQTLIGDERANIIYAGGGNDRLVGGGGNDAFNAGAGDDRIDGGTGADAMGGFAGNDVFIVDDAGDKVIEAAGEGTDEIRTALASYSLETLAHVENLTGTADTGQVLTGNAANNLIVGGMGDDTIYGLGGDDIIVGFGGFDVMRGGAGDDVYAIDAGDTVIELDGEGVDEIRTVGAIFVLGVGLENLRATSDVGHDFRGNLAPNAIIGGDGNDIIRLQDGGGDVAFGKNGNDSFYFGGAFDEYDFVDGGDNRDSLILQGMYNMTLVYAPTGRSSIANVEGISLVSGTSTQYGQAGTSLYSYNLTLVDDNAGAGALMKVNGFNLQAGENLTLNASAETDAPLQVFAGLGTETLTGGGQGDAFVFGHDGRFGAGDTVNGGGGYDIVYLRGDYTVDFNAAGFGNALTNVESIALLTSANTEFVSGGDGEFDYVITWADALLASGATFTVNGSRLQAHESFVFDGSQETNGVLRVFGGAAADALTGGAGPDQITGGGGADVLAGGAGADLFRYAAATDSIAGAADTIHGFVAGTDKIDLNRVDAKANTVDTNEAFAFIGGNAFSAAGPNAPGELRAFNVSGNLWQVEGDVNGDGTADLVIQVHVDAGQPLTAADFVL